MAHLLDDFKRSIETINLALFHTGIYFCSISPHSASQSHNLLKETTPKLVHVRLAKSFKAVVLKAQTVISSELDRLIAS